MAATKSSRSKTPRILDNPTVESTLEDRRAEQDDAAICPTCGSAEVTQLRQDERVGIVFTRRLCRKCERVFVGRSPADSPIG